MGHTDQNRSCSVAAKMNASPTVSFYASSGTEFPARHMDVDIKCFPGREIWVYPS